MNEIAAFKNSFHSVEITSCACYIKTKAVINIWQVSRYRFRNKLQFETDFYHKFCQFCVYVIEQTIHLHMIDQQEAHIPPKIDSNYSPFVVVVLFLVFFLRSFSLCTGQVVLSLLTISAKRGGFHKICIRIRTQCLMNIPTYDRYVNDVIHQHQTVCWFSWLMIKSFHAKPHPPSTNKPYIFKLCTLHKSQNPGQTDDVNDVL